MSRDISSILSEWEFDPDEVKVRIVQGEDGRPKLQMRVDLGVLQMEMEGRPDGQRPNGCQSWLEFYQRQQSEHDAAHPDSTPYRLDEEACSRLWSEGVQFYHRYLSFWHLQRYDLCARDTDRNLRLFAFVREHASDDRAKRQFDQWRPYVTMMHARAVAMPMIEGGRSAEALQVIDSAMEAIRAFLREYGQDHREDECAELATLQRWRDEVLTAAESGALSDPAIILPSLHRRLQAAIDGEEFEEAARLRDEIRRLSGPGQ